MLVKLIHDLLSCDPQFEKYYPRNSKRWSDGKQKGKERERERNMGEDSETDMC